MIRLFLTSLFVVTIFFAPKTVLAQNYNLICYQEWCYTGDKDNSVKATVMPTSGNDDLGMGVYIFKSKIEFWEMPFRAGRYRIKANVVTNKFGQLVAQEVINSTAIFSDGIVIVGLKAGFSTKLKAGRFFKVRIYHNDRLAYTATYPLYGFSKAYRHMH